MKWAEKNRERILANPITLGAKCPYCKSEVIAKCGDIKVWHWAHKKDNSCDNWWEAETEWHLNWKNNFPKENQEYIIESDGKKHFADIFVKGLVVEFQNSNISIDEIQERERFYKNMIWVLNGAKFAQNLNLRKKGNFYTFRWKWPPRIWFNSSASVYIDMNPLVDLWKEELKNMPDRKYSDFYNAFIDNRDKKDYIKRKIFEFEDKVFLIKKIYSTLPCGGWGKMFLKDSFIEGIKYGYKGN